ncbi:MAG: LCP family protein [Acidimicrobiales bacterium]
MAGRHVRRLVFRAVVVLGCTAILLAAVGFGYVEYRNHQIRRISVQKLVPTPPSGMENILLVGSSSNCILPAGRRASFGKCPEVTPSRSDTVMLVHLDPKNGSASILSIPRDLFLPIPNSTSANRVDDALNISPEQLVATVEDDLGIPVNHFVELNLDGFENVVNALGGVDMYFPDLLSDTYSGLNITKSGCRHLNGSGVLAVVRSRHLYYKDNGSWHYDSRGDLGRVQRGQEVLKVLASSVRRRGLSNPLTDNALISAIAPEIRVDQTFSLSEMLGLILRFHALNPTAAPTQTLPVRIDRNMYTYRGGDYGGVLFPSEPQDASAIDSFLGISSPPWSSIAPSSISVAVEDGMPGATQALSVASALRSLNFDVLSVGKAPPVGPVAETVIYYRPGAQDKAERLLEAMSGAVTIASGPTTKGADVTLVTGSDFSVHGSRTTAAPLFQVSSGAMSLVTVPHTALAAWDPRSCPATGGG